MTRRARRNHTAAFKAKAALTAWKGEKTLSELAQQFEVHALQVKQWKDQLPEGAAGIFATAGPADPATPAVAVKTLHARIGELTLVSDFP